MRTMDPSLAATWLFAYLIVSLAHPTLALSEDGGASGRVYENAVIASSHHRLSSATIAVKELIDNGKFDQLTNGQPTGWRQSTWSGVAEFRVDADHGHTGAPCVAISSESGGDASWSFPVKVKRNTNYRLTAWVKTENLVAGSGNGVQLNLHELQFEGKSQSLAGTNDWTQLVSEFNSGNRNSILVNLLFGGWGQSTGTVWFDDVSLVEIAAPIPTMTEEEAFVFFRERIKPILAEKCWECHGNDPADLGGDLALTSRKDIHRGGESGAAVDAESPLESILLKAVNYDVFEMPPDDKLPKSQIADIQLWIQLGMPWPAEEEKELAREEASEHGGGKPSGIDWESAKQWWSFQPVQRPAVPTVNQTAWPINDIDRFILNGLETGGFSPAPEASRETLIRRAFYDLLGLPPTPTQVREFVADPDPQAYEKLIDRLLESPHYGEKWGRHWLDLVRYAESNSFERDGTKPFVWRYRDYVIRSLNQDKPYDQFLREQLAGDELPEVTAETLAATGYFRLGQWDDEPADPEQARFDDLDDILATTSQTMLGLTVNCARCHDHKIDPITAADYYQLLSFFNNIRRYGIRSDESVADASIRTFGADGETRSERREQLTKIQSEMKELEAIAQKDFIPVEFQEFEYEFQKIPLMQKRVGSLLTQAQFDRYRELAQQRNEIRDRAPSGQQKILCVKENGGTPRETFIQVRGNAHVQGKAVSPKFISILGGEVPDITPPAHGESTGHRLAFAKWITRADHPLTSRVMVNRMWQYHFGRGLVRTASDFGLQGARPTHPELLDWLAQEFIAQGWRLKPLHRQMMLSRTYRMSSQWSPQNAATDPDNDRFWRYNMRRLTAEEIRDSILFANGQLNLNDMFGASIFPKLPREVLQGQSRPGDGWGNSNEDQQRRRSVYIHVKRSLRVPIIETFDGADTDFSCPVRFVTTQPGQALGMLNSDFAWEQAAKLAEWSNQQNPESLERRVYVVLERVTQRTPQPSEQERSLSVIRAWQTDDGLTAEQAFHNFCLMALNLNEFVFVD